MLRYYLLCYFITKKKKKNYAILTVFSHLPHTFMATVIKLFSLVILVVLLANSKGVSSTNEPTISASPGVLPYVSSPDISSFFPTPSANQPMSSGSPFEAEAPAPAPTSGQFDGKNSSGSAMLDSAGAIVAALICCCAFISSIVIV